MLYLKKIRLIMSYSRNSSIHPRRNKLNIIVGLFCCNHIGFDIDVHRTFDCLSYTRYVGNQSLQNSSKLFVNAFRLQLQNVVSSVAKMQ